MEILQNWILLAVLTPTLWALGCVLDSCLIGSKIFRSPADGAIISCLFCLAPALLALGIDSSTFVNTIAENGMPHTAIIAGISFAVHLYFYFRTLHRLNDVSGAETFITLSVLLVPLFAWALLGERLPAHYYLAFAIAATSTLIQCLPMIKNVGLSLLFNMIVTMVAVSLAMVLQASSLDTHGFTTSTIVFNLTAFLLAAVCILSQRATRNRIKQLYRSYTPILVLGEALGILAVMSSHRATEKGPSVSLVALIECLLPLIIIGISFALITYNRFWPILSRDHRSTLALQLREMPTKVAALSLLIGSLTLLTL